MILRLFCLQYKFQNSLKLHIIVQKLWISESTHNLIFMEDVTCPCLLCWIQMCEFTSKCLLMAASLWLVLFEQLAGDNQPLDLTGALVDLGDAGVAVVPFGGHVRHVAHPTQDLNGLVWRTKESQWKRAFSSVSSVRRGFLTWWEQKVAASDAASLAMAASCSTLTHASWRLRCYNVSLFKSFLTVPWWRVSLNLGELPPSRWAGEHFLLPQPCQPVWTKTTGQIH